jgi:hypothetical protein
MCPMWGFRVLNGLWALFPLVLVLLALRPVSARELGKFSVRYGVEINSETRPAMDRYIRRGRTVRLAGAALGLSLHSVLYAVGLSIPNDDAFYGIVGYLLGAFVGALLPHSNVVEPRTASLVPRQMSDYLPRAALVAPVVAVGVGALAAVVFEIEPRRVLPDFTGSNTGLVLAVIAAAGTLTSIWIVIGRSQPITTRGLVTVDDAMRTEAVHTLVGTGTAIALLGASSCLFEMGGYASPTWLHVAGVVAGLCAVVGALLAWVFTGAAWRVRRAPLK